jgi:hypothetical protein
MQPIYDEIVALTDAFCKEHLNAEYAELVRKMTAALCRKRPSPLLSGRPRTWACGIVYAVGQANFLFDKSQDPHLRADDLCESFGVAQTTGNAKAKTIRDALRMRMFDAKWSLPSKIATHPMAWLISVNGLVVDARRMPREIQEEAFRRGMIPFLPE